METSLCKCITCYYAPFGLCQDWRHKIKTGISNLNQSWNGTGRVWFRSLVCNLTRRIASLLSLRYNIFVWPLFSIKLSRLSTVIPLASKTISGFLINKIILYSGIWNLPSFMRIFSLAYTHVKTMYVGVRGGWLSPLRQSSYKRSRPLPIKIAFPCLVSPSLSSPIPFKDNTAVQMLPKRAREVKSWGKLPLRIAFAREKGSR